jgi:hypothetical protein
MSNILITTLIKFAKKENNVEITDLVLKTLFDYAEKDKIDVLLDLRNNQRNPDVIGGQLGDIPSCGMNLD